MRNILYVGFHYNQSKAQVAIGFTPTFEQREIQPSRELVS